ncbi:MAG: hypothetical protein P8X96_24745 [Desulfobacteraceae bacterium]|jgi:hypothetical protein
MKQYVIDELRPDDYRKIKEYLDANFSVDGYEGLYWLLLDETAYADVQKDHTDCQPFYFALELTSRQLACELLVRTNNQMKCKCIRYATADQINWLVRSLDAISDRLGIVT